MGSWRPVDLELCLGADFINWSLIGQLSNELVSLNVDILFAWGCLWGLNITSEELLSGFGSLLLEALRVVLAFVSLK